MKRFFTHKYNFEQATLSVSVFVYCTVRFGLNTAFIVK